MLVIPQISFFCALRVKEDRARQKAMVISVMAILLKTECVNVWVKLANSAKVQLSTGYIGKSLNQ